MYGKHNGDGQVVSKLSKLLLTLLLVARRLFISLDKITYFHLLNKTIKVVVLKEMFC